MSTKSPIFSVPEPQHYSDYGFDPQLDHFQVLEEAGRHGNRETRSLDALHFRLRKPVLKLKDDPGRSCSENKKYGGRWWRNALLFFKRKRGDVCGGGDHVGHHRMAAPYSSMSYPSSPYTGCRAAATPVYLTDSSDAGSWTPCRITNVIGGWGHRPSSGPLRFNSETGVDVEVPYLCLRDPAAMGAPPSSAPCPPPAMPIYVVT